MRGKIQYRSYNNILATFYGFVAVLSLLGVSVAVWFFAGCFCPD